MYYIYVLKSLKDESLYYGRTRNLKRRLKEHNNGKTKSIRHKNPFKLIYYETADNLTDAIKKEKYFKTGFGRKYIKNKINNLDR